MIKKMDLVLVSPNLDIPVCKIMNYGKYNLNNLKRERSKKETKDFRIKRNNELLQT